MKYFNLLDWAIKYQKNFKGMGSILWEFATVVKTVALLICMIVLVMFRLIKRKYMLKNPKEPGDHRDWTCGMSGYRIQKALQKWKVVPMKAGNYWFADIDDPDLAKILEAYDLEIPKKLYTDGKMRRLEKRIKTF